jgi:hypothetical protein
VAGTLNRNLRQNFFEGDQPPFGAGFNAQTIALLQSAEEATLSKSRWDRLGKCRSRE